MDRIHILGASHNSKSTESKRIRNTICCILAVAIIISIMAGCGRNQKINVVYDSEPELVTDSQTILQDGNNKDSIPTFNITLDEFANQINLYGTPLTIEKSTSNNKYNGNLYTTDKKRIIVNYEIVCDQDRKIQSVDFSPNIEQLTNILLTDKSQLDENDIRLVFSATVIFYMNTVQVFEPRFDETIAIEYYHDLTDKRTESLTYNNTLHTISSLNEFGIRITPTENTTPSNAADSNSGDYVETGENQSTDNPWITLAEYNKLEIGMSYQQVCNIIGSAGENGGSTTYTKVYMWWDENKSGCAVLYFKDGELYTKQDFSLSDEPIAEPTVEPTEEPIISEPTPSPTPEMETGPFNTTELYSSFAYMVSYDPISGWAEFDYFDVLTGNNELIDWLISHEDYTFEEAQAIVSEWNNDEYLIKNTNPKLRTIDLNNVTIQLIVYSDGTEVEDHKPIHSTIDDINTLYYSNPSYLYDYNYYIMVDDNKNAVSISQIYFAFPPANVSQE